MLQTRGKIGPHVKNPVHAERMVASGKPILEGFLFGQIWALSNSFIEYNYLH